MFLYIQFISKETLCEIREIKENTNPVFNGGFVVYLLRQRRKKEAPAAAKATTMSLMKTKGSVNIDERDGKQIEPVKNLKLYSGYSMLTKKTVTPGSIWIT